jgi:hypothetical protein
MPSLARRRDFDSRGTRLESEITNAEVARGFMAEKQRLPFCSKCKTGYEEQSKVCPRCDTKTMGYLAPIPEKFREEARRGAIKRARAKAGL